MELGVRDSARLLNVSEKTIYRWIKQGLLPAYRVHDQYRFNSAELLEWATTQRVSVSPEMFAEPRCEAELDGLASAIQEGGIHYGVAGGDKATILRSAVALMKISSPDDREFLLQLLLARETLGTTAVGRGIALPHARSPVVMQVAQPTITLCFLAEPVEFGAPDGQPVGTLFTLLSPTVRAHLHMLARLSFALQQADFAETILRRASREAIWAASAKIDQQISEVVPDGLPNHHE
ncbi:MAG: PTS sugar transporter subunit IIA [Pirellulaceae bacterium]